MSRSDEPAARADREVDRLYASLRSRHGRASARANGYRLQRYFTREQEMILAEVAHTRGIVVDIGCGSGLLAAPLARRGRCVLGIDFNRIACRDARANGIRVVRGDAFRLPFAERSIGCVVNSQFLNQQHPASARRLVEECARILHPGGRAILVWRNGSAWIHRAAQAVYGVLDVLSARPRFPHVDHPIEALCGHARGCGLRVLCRQLVFPLWRWRSDAIDSPAARLIGASAFVVLAQPGEE